jgi:hypothetical protein
VARTVNQCAPHRRVSASRQKRPLDRRRKLDIRSAMSSDLTFITNESGKHLRDRFGVLLGEDTRFFDCLVGYFFNNPFSTKEN